MPLFPRHEVLTCLTVNARQSTAVVIALPRLVCGSHVLQYTLSRYVGTTSTSCMYCTHSLHVRSRRAENTCRTSRLSCLSTYTGVLHQVAGAQICSLLQGPSHYCFPIWLYFLLLPDRRVETYPCAGHLSFLYSVCLVLQESGTSP